MSVILARRTVASLLADLRGHRLAFTRGSSAHNVVVKALAKAGLTLADIQIDIRQAVWHAPASPS